METPAQRRASVKYKEAHYEFIKVRLTKGQNDQLKALAEAEGKSRNQYILDRILPNTKDTD